MTNATEVPIDLTFCDLCGVSIPIRDVQAGMTKSVDGKTVGACCLSRLLAGASPPRVSEGASAAKTASAPTTGLSLVFATAVVIAGILAAAWYIDFRAQERDPASALHTLEGRIAALEGVLDGYERRAERGREALVREATGSMAPRFTTLESGIEKLQASIPKPGGDLNALKGRLANLDTRLGELLTRQGSIESKVEAALRGVREELGNVDRALVELRSKGVAAGDASAPASAPPSEEPNLPANLRRHVAALTSADPGERWSAVDELVRSGDKRVVPSLMPMLADKDPFVRRLCAEGLAQLGDESACGALIDALDDKEAIVRESAYKTLVKLSGKKHPFDAEGSDAARRTMVRRWRQWWEKERAAAK